MYTPIWYDFTLYKILGYMIVTSIVMCRNGEQVKK